MTIQENTTLFDMTETYPETIDVLVDAGFKRMTDPDLRRQFGSSISVQAAAHARGMEPEDLLARLRAAIPANPAGARSAGAPQAAADTASTPASQSEPIRIVGLVPCPVRIPMTNVLESASEAFTAETGMSVEYDLQAAYMGTDWMEENLSQRPDATELPEIFLSAGFRLFFTDERFRRLRREGAFTDRTAWSGMNEFAQANNLADPEGRFSVVGVVPAVFMVNRDLLGDRELPRSWADILSPEYENSLALPIGDFDLFDSLLLGVWRNFGRNGIRRLARNMFQQMHPAQMVAGATKRRAGDAGGQPAPGDGGNSADNDQPLITIMPYFFTRTINEKSPLEAVWPSDGALAAPILLVTRSDRPEMQPLVDAIAGAPMSRVLSRLGLFPSTHPENSDFSPEEHPLQWPGWDLLLSDTLPATLAQATRDFHEVLKERAGGAA